MKALASVVGIFLMCAAGSCINPFAPKLDTSPAQASCDPMTPEGVFQCIQVAYTFRDTTVYAPLLDDMFVFVWRDYDNGGIDVTWGRDTELRTTHGLFQNVQRLDLIWNNIISRSDSAQVRTTIVRGFNLTITFNPSDIARIDGYANITMVRSTITSPWKIIRWRDESNF
ncbi:MAG TPA: hypothetical protein VNL69_10085 [Bacteroidota bacterium]|nr:hypothetical protein [Bacteroidota bacterium]